MSNLLFVVVLEILSGRTPPATRLRLFPKHALKGFGIGCLSIRAVDGDKTPGGGGVGGVSVTDGGGGTERVGTQFSGMGPSGGWTHHAGENLRLLDTFGALQKPYTNNGGGWGTGRGGGEVVFWLR